MAKASHRFDGPISNFQLRYDGTRTLKGDAGLGNHCRVNRVIGGLSDGDQILPGDAVNQDERDSARQCLDALEVIDIDTLLDQTVSGICSESVRTVGTQKCSGPTRTSGGNRLIRALAATKHIELPAEDRFAGVRQSIA